MKVLIVKLGAIGDVVKSLPMIEAAKTLSSEVRVAWLCGKTVEPLLRLVPGIDELVVVDDRRLLAGSPLERLWVLISLWIKIFARSFDVVATAYLDRRYRLLTWTVFAKSRRFLGDLRRGSRPPPDLFQGDEYARLVTGREDLEPGKFKIPKLKVHASVKLESLLGKNGPLRAALAPGGAKNVLVENSLRRWPIEEYVRLAALLLKKNVEVVLSGAETDRWVVPYFEGLPVKNLVGETPLPDLVALYGRCALVVAHDSGPLHLAVLAGAPVIGLFGPTRPDEMLEKGPAVRMLWGGAKLACRPCYDGKHFAKCSDNQCLKEITAEQVMELAGDWV